MRFLVGLLPLMLVAATGQNPEGDAIRVLVQRYMDARNHQDATALRSLFTEDADQLVSSGEWRRGVGALVDGGMASSRKESGESTVILESVRFLGSDAAIADGRYEVSVMGSAAPRKMWSTFVLERTKAGWRIAAIRNMLPTGPQR